MCATEPSKKTINSEVLAPMSIRQTPSSRSSAEMVASAAAIDSRTVSVTSRPALFAQVTMLCCGACRAGGDVEIDFQAIADHTDGVVNAGLFVEDELLGQKVDDLAVGRERDGPGAIDGGAHVFSGDFAEARAQADAAAAVQTADVGPPLWR